jgi:hypothetical protein
MKAPTQTEADTLGGYKSLGLDVTEPSFSHARNSTRFVKRVGLDVELAEIFVDFEPTLPGVPEETDRKVAPPP